MNNIQIDVIDNFFDVELQDEIFEKIKSSSGHLMVVVLRIPFGMQII